MSFPDQILSNHPCPSISGSSMVCRLSVFKYLGDHSLVVSNFLHEVRHHKGILVTELDFFNKDHGGSQMGYF